MRTRAGFGAKPWLADEAFATQLDCVEFALQRAVTAESGPAAQLSMHMVNAGGKRLRAVLTLLGARFGNGATEDVIRAACAVELMHLASLSHDDVIDQARQRRGVDSVNSRWGNEAAAFVGGYVLSRSTALLATLDADAARLACAATGELWRGQMRELEAIYQLDVDEKHCLEVAAQKTGSLYALACRLGCSASGAPLAQQRRLEDYGRCLGIAFQLVDDVLDIVGPAELLGKAPGRDLREGVYTLPVVYTLTGRCEGADALRRAISLRDRDDAGIDDARCLLMRNGSVPATLQMARRFALDAESAVGGLDAQDGTPVADWLGAIVRHVFEPVATFETEAQPWT